MDFILALLRVFLCRNSLSAYLYEDAVRNLKKIPESYYTVHFDRCCVENVDVESYNVVEKDLLYIFPLYFIHHFISKIHTDSEISDVALHGIANINIISQIV